MDSLSIILTAHNCAPVVGRTLASLEDSLARLRAERAHADAPVEILMVDDGSTDGTGALLAAFAVGRPEWNVLRRPTCSSPSCARNLGAGEARGGVLLFLDGDDRFLPNHLVDCRGILANPALDFIKTGVRLADPVHPQWRERIESSLAINLAVRRRCHEFIGGFPDLHLMRRDGDRLVHETDLFYKIEDHYYNVLLHALFRGRKLTRETVEYCRYPGNSYDRQYSKFCCSPETYREDLPLEEQLRRTVCDALIQDRIARLNKAREGVSTSPGPAPSVEKCRPHASREDSHAITTADVDLTRSVKTALPDNSPELARALTHFQRRDYPLAESICSERIDADPRDAVALHLLGVIAHRTGRYSQAVDFLRQAIAALPGVAEFHYNLGTVFQFNGRLEEAVACFHTALELRPDHAETCSNLGYALTMLGRAHEAVEYLRRAVTTQPAYAEAQNNLGLALKELGKLDEAIVGFRRAVQLRSDYPEAQANLGAALFRRGEFEAAEEVWGCAVRLQPDNPFARNHIGWACQESGKQEQALEHLSEAVRLKPDYGEAHNNRGVVLSELGRFAEARASLNEAIALKADYIDAITNLGLACALEGKVDEAVVAYDRALTFAPGHVPAHLNRALALLQAGEFARAWPEYEWRCKLPGYIEATFAKPKWEGEPLEGRRILLYADQGLGDTLQFIRYAALVKQRGGDVTVACQKGLLPLLSRCPGIDRLVATGVPWSECDVHASLMSLPGIFGTTLADIPADVPYLHADPALIERWGSELSSLPGFKVGIGWQGNPKFVNDRRRSIPLAAFLPLYRARGVCLIGLQKGPGSEQVSALADRMAVLDLARRLDETSGAFVDTAAVMMNLDLVITSDTALAHLAGGLGVPVWVVLHAGADWRFLMNRDDSPWYPTMRLFRQTRWGDWDEVFERVARELARIGGSRPR